MIVQRDFWLVVVLTWNRRLQHGRLGGEMSFLLVRGACMSPINNNRDRE